MADNDGIARNALAGSQSPYLLQHAGNPVHWKEWGEDAFEEARQRDVPILLSVGYSTCHWCHVMARESFEDEAIAALLNQRFVNVKLDREERPDIDRIYMSYVQSTTGSGGWPMNVWLTPELKPFYGGTYFPPEDRYGRVGFRTLVMRIGELWESDRATLLEYGEKSFELLRDNAALDTNDAIANASSAFERCLSELESEYDEVFGGFGGAPKFPMPSFFAALVEGVARLGNDQLEAILVDSLEKMAAGGIWDHVGDGFHRYSVDRYWHVPHYEKMLYDQGQLAAIYAEAYRLTGREAFAEIARRIVVYVRRDLKGEDGELFAAEDADSVKPDAPNEHGEGAFYVWRQEELDTLLGDDASLFSTAFDTKPDGNAGPDSDPHGELKGLNTLRRVVSSAELAKRFGMDENEVEARLNQDLRRLFEKRAGRPRPHLDDKSIVSWSALMISGACRVYQATGDDASLDLARDSARFVFERMWDESDVRLWRVFRKERGRARGFAEDYAALALACSDLYECDFDPVRLERSVQLLDRLGRSFEDGERGGFFATEAGDESVIARLRDDYDGAEPAASSLAAMALLRLASLLDDDRLREKGRRTIEAFGAQWSGAPRAMPLMLVAASRFLQSDQQIVVVGSADDESTNSLIRVANRWRKPYSVLHRVEGGRPLPEVLRNNRKLATLMEAAPVGVALAYVCENYSCQSPVSSALALRDLLAEG